MKKILVLYATREGQTEKIAQVIAGHLSGEKCELVLENVAALKNPEQQLAMADLLVFGASIHAGKIEKELSAFIYTYQELIESKSRAFFLVLLAAATKDKARRDKSLAEIRHKLGSEFNAIFPDIDMMAGALRYTKYNWFIKWMMQRIAAKEGGDTDTSRDYEYTDWQQVEKFALGLLDR